VASVVAGFAIVVGMLGGCGFGANEGSEHEEDGEEQSRCRGMHD
jgi:hypothetical protein